MGGNALKQHKAVRLEKNDYDRVAGQCIARLRGLYPDGRIEAIQAYREKQDFGDLDVLVAADGYDPLKASDALSSVEVVRNGPVTSVGVETPNGGIFQVDLIKSPLKEFDYASRYFRWNDLGNLVGRIAHAMGVAHRHDGLYFYYRDGDHLFREILLTLDHDLALTFLGFDPMRFNRGFDTLEDVFRFVASSCFFNRDIYLLQNRNAKSRVRDSKRPSYMQFLAWCESRPDLPSFSFPVDKGSWLPRIAEHFPSFSAEHEKAKSDLARIHAAKEKFNGELASRITGLQGKPLGEQVRKFRDSFESTEAQQDFVLSASPGEIENRIRQFHA